MSEKLKPCPFCGKDIATLTTCVEIAGCENFESCNNNGVYSCVVCGMKRGGCGASGGYFPTKAESIAAWNRRDYAGNRPACVGTAGGDKSGGGRLI